MAMTNRHPDWPDGFFDNVIGSCADNPIERAPQCMRCNDGKRVHTKTEMITPEYLRSQLRAIVERIPDDDLLEHLEDWKAE